MKTRFVCAGLLLVASLVGCGSDNSIVPPEGPVEAAPSTLKEKANDENKSTPTAPAMIPD